VTQDGVIRRLPMPREKRHTPTQFRGLADYTFSLKVSSASVFTFRFALLLARKCTLEINPKFSR
jgi:hypothetical protein